MEEDTCPGTCWTGGFIDSARIPSTTIFAKYLSPWLSHRLEPAKEQVQLRAAGNFWLPGAPLGPGAAVAASLF